MPSIDALISIARKYARELNEILDDLQKAGVRTRVIPVDFMQEQRFILPFPSDRVQLQILDVKHGVTDAVE